MEIRWEDIFTKSQGQATSKFKFLPKHIPWTDSYEENVFMTLEWIMREGKAPDIRYSPEAVVNVVRDNWYRVEFEEGRFVHVCYPAEFLKFRSQYEGLVVEIKQMEYLDLTDIDTIATNARSKLWSAWGCLGHDGIIKEEMPATDDDQLPLFQYERKWSNSCDRCCSPLPKALQMWVKLRHSKLADAL